jgi:hypothetical protein
VQEWEGFLESFTSEGKDPPDLLQREITRLATNQAKRQARHADTSSDLPTAAVSFGGQPEGDDDDVSVSLDPEWANQLAVAAGGVDPDLKAFAEAAENANQVVWDKEHDFSTPVHDYTGNHAPVAGDIGKVATKLIEEAKKSEAAAMKARPYNELKPGQQHAYDVVLGCVKREHRVDDLERLMIMLGVGGTGKSEVIHCITKDLNEHFDNPRTVVKLATTGKAASVIGGDTLHSWKDGLAIPTTDCYFELKDKTLANFQAKFRHAKLIICDEFSMIRPRELEFMDRRLKEIMANQEPFGGLAILLVGDPGQLPPVGSPSLWGVDVVAGKQSDEFRGAVKYLNMFKTVVRLTESNRIDTTDPLSKWFREFLLRLRDGKCTNEDYEMVRSNCSCDSMTPLQWKEAGFENDDAVHLYTTNNAVNEYNASRLKKLGNPIALVEADGSSGHGKFKDDKFWGLETSLYLAVGARVYMTQNVSAKLGLVNGSQGIVKDLIYEPGKNTPSLPKFVWVDFGEAYKGTTFFPKDKSRKGWFPVLPKTVPYDHYTGRKAEKITYSRTMLPLRLCYAWTVWKAQGQTFKCPVVADLSNVEKEHGLTYTAFSRVQRLKNFGIIGGLNRDRLCSKISSGAKLKRRLLEEDRLSRLELETTQRWENRQSDTRPRRRRRQQ